MKKVNWNKLAKRIPAKFKMGRQEFKIIWTQKIEDDPKCYGLSDWNNKRIYIKTGQSAKEKVLTYLHEVTHIFSDQFGIKISEKQVQKIEKNLYNILTRDNIFL